MAKPTSRRQDGGNGGFPGMDPTQFAANLEPLFQAGTKMLEHWRVVSEELMEFGRTRLTRNIEVGRKVAQCSSVDQALEAQAEYARSAMQDYIAESGKLAELGTRALFGSFAAWQPAQPKSPRSMLEPEASEERAAAE